MSQFPATSIDSFNTKVDGVDYPTAASINDLQSAVVEIETKVGIDNSANTASLDYLKKLLYPIGTVYTNYSNATNPGTLFGFGTWVAIEGEIVVGYKSGDADFGTPSGAAGAKTSAHTHTGPSHTHVGASHQHWVAGNTGTPSSGQFSGSGSGSIPHQSHTHSIGINADFEGQRATTSAGTEATGSTSPSTLQPSRTCYIWRRSA